MNELMNYKDAYGIKVAMLIDNPKHAGTISEAEAEALDGTLFTYTYGSEAIGERVDLYWVVNPQDDTILTAAFTHFGSPAGIAVHDMLALLCKNKTVQQAGTMTYAGLERFLRDNPDTPALAPCENYVITLGLDAIKQASKAYYKEAPSQDEQTLPCHDTPMSLSAIKEQIRLHDIQSLQALTEYTKAGYSDSDCKSKLLELIEAHQAKLNKQKDTTTDVPDIPFREMDTKEKITAINKTVDESIRQFLIMDGGDIEILDIKENGKHLDVYIRYLGACSGCASSSTGTLFGIEKTLKDNLDEQIRVLPI